MTPHEKLLLMQRAAEMVDYNSETGAITWRRRDVYVRGWSNKLAGKECGVINTGYRVIAFRFGPSRRFMVMAHRLAWFISFGVMPSGEIDHINRDRADNRIANLRDVSSSMNKRNFARKGNNTSGVPGVNWDKHRGKWFARARVDGRAYNLGRFDELTDADKAVRKFRSEHGFTETHGQEPTR
jgi:hypothetical protein